MRQCDEAFGGLTTEVKLKKFAARKPNNDGYNDLMFTAGKMAFKMLM